MGHNTGASYSVLVLILHVLDNTKMTVFIPH